MSAGNDESPASKIKYEEVKLVELSTGALTKSIEDDYDDIFCIDGTHEEVYCIDTPSQENKIWCILGGLDVEVVVDSGSRYNIVDRQSWMDLKAKGIKTLQRQKEVHSIIGLFC